MCAGVWVCRCGDVWSIQSSGCVCSTCPTPRCSTHLNTPPHTHTPPPPMYLEQDVQHPLVFCRCTPRPLGLQTGPHQRQWVGHQLPQRTAQHTHAQQRIGGDMMHTIGAPTVGDPVGVPQGGPTVCSRRCGGSGPPLHGRDPRTGPTTVQGHLGGKGGPQWCGQGKPRGCGGLWVVPPPPWWVWCCRSTAILLLARVGAACGVARGCCTTTRVWSGSGMRPTGQTGGTSSSTNSSGGGVCSWHGIVSGTQVCGGSARGSVSLTQPLLHQFKCCNINASIGPYAYLR